VAAAPLINWLMCAGWLADWVDAAAPQLMAEYIQMRAESESGSLKRPLICNCCDTTKTAAGM